MEAGQFYLEAMQHAVTSTATSCMKLNKNKTSSKWYDLFL